MCRPNGDDVLLLLLEQLLLLKLLLLQLLLVQLLSLELLLLELLGLLLLQQLLLQLLLVPLLLLLQLLLFLMLLLLLLLEYLLLLVLLYPVLLKHLLLLLHPVLVLAADDGGHEAVDAGRVLDLQWAHGVGAAHLVAGVAVDARRGAAARVPAVLEAAVRVLQAVLRAVARRDRRYAAR